MNDTLHTGSKFALYGGAGAAGLIFGMNLSEIATFVAMSVALLGFCLQLWTSLNRNRRAEELHAATLEALRANPSAITIGRAEDSSSDNEG